MADKRECSEKGCKNEVSFTIERDTHDANGDVNGRVKKNVCAYHCWPGDQIVAEGV